MLKKCMSFLMKDENFLEKYNKIWKKVCNIINKEFNSNLLYNGKYIKTKMKSYNGKINVNLIIPKESSHCVCLLMIFIASVYKK